MLSIAQHSFRAFVAMYVSGFFGSTLAYYLRWNTFVIVFSFLVMFTLTKRFYMKCIPAQCPKCKREMYGHFYGHMWRYVCTQCKHRDPKT
jgi:hypothetical protein